jgi:hypothetical protein
MNIRLIVLVFFYSLLCYAQSDSIQIETGEIIEDLVDEPEEESDNSDLYEEFENFVEHPVNINSASLEDLIKIPYFDLAIAGKIIDHRDKYGPFFSINELYTISDIPENLLRKSLVFLTTSNSSEKKNYDKKNDHSTVSFTLRNRILYDIQPVEGFKENVFVGSNFKTYSRLQIDYRDNLKSGILIAKDAGEISYADFTSGYIMISNFLNISSIIIGDYIPRFGKGLALWGSYGLTKNSNKFYSIKKYSGIIKPYSGSMENNYFRGAAVEQNWEHAQVSIFYSVNHLDANIDTISGYITSITLDGLHRTATEISKGNSAIEKTYGFAIKSDLFNSIYIGALYYNSRFNYPIKYDNLLDKYGDIFNYFSSYIDLYLNNFNVFGELTYDGNSTALITGVNCSISPKFDYVFSIRNYSSKYFNLHGYGFGEKAGDVNNEFGIYNSIRWSTIIGDLIFYFDQFKFPFSTYSNPLPSQGNEIMMSLNSYFLGKIEFNFKYKFENKEITDELYNQKELIKRLKQSYRAEIIFNLLPSIRLKTRFEYLKYFVQSAENLEEGYLIHQDLRIKTLDNLTIYCRAALFNTDSFNSAIYEYENDMPGIMYSAGLYGKGVRLYIALKYEFIKRSSVSIKYSETYKPSESSMRSGYSEIEGNLDNRLGLQFDVNF